MSHFKVLVIGDNIEEQLDPYDETRKVEPYREDDYDFQQDVLRAATYFGELMERGDEDNKDRPKTFKELMDWWREGDDSLRWNEDGSSAEQWSTYNPDSKWDYWVIGGRYNATFKVKPDADPADFSPSEYHWSEEYGNKADHAGFSDQARKRAIDFKAMISRATAEAEKDLYALRVATDGLTPPAYGWAECREKHGEDIDAARQEWNNHPWNVATRKAGYWDAYEHFHMDAEDPGFAYVSDREHSAVAGFYAVVRDGQWMARGEMGWFGMGSGDEDRGEWIQTVHEIIDSLPEDALLTVVDCHI